MFTYTVTALVLGRRLFITIRTFATAPFECFEPTVVVVSLTSDKLVVHVHLLSIS